MFGASALIRMASAMIILSGAETLAHGEHHDVVRRLTPQIEGELENTKLRYQLTAAHVEHDEWKLALAECDRIEKIAPGKLQLGYFRGRSLATAERWEEALIHLDEFLKSEPSDQEALIWRARVHLRLEDPVKSSADFRMALEKCQNPEYHAEFAKVLARQGLADQSVTALQHALKLSPDDPALLECMVECATTAKDTPAGLAAKHGVGRILPFPGFLEQVATTKHKRLHGPWQFYRYEVDNMRIRLIRTLDPSNAATRNDDKLEAAIRELLDGTKTVCTPSTAPKVERIIPVN